MFIVGNFLIAVATIIGIILWLLTWLIVIRALISWVNPDPYNPIVVFLQRSTDPLLEPIRRQLPRMQVDFSPFIAILVIIFVRVFLVASLTDLGLRLKSEARQSRIIKAGVMPLDQGGTADDMMYR
ncbi:MAG: YggT family protein [Candidatus Omnitrophica bacterium]|nr:YggT family protein [Candidatus Omnitrophota bacterium]